MCSQHLTPLPQTITEYDITKA